MHTQQWQSQLLNSQAKQVVYAHAGQYWEVEFDLPPLNAAQAAQWAGALLSLNGREGTFYVYPSETQPQSPITGTKLIRSVSDYEVTFESLSGTGSFTVGDWVDAWWHRWAL